MRISLNWVNELVDIQDVELDNLVEKLTLGGFEVEEIIKLNIFDKQQIILDISATANRADSLSTYGIGLEIAALLNKTVQKSSYNICRFEPKQILDNLLETKTTISNNKLSVFSSLTIENLTNITSPGWLKEKLITADIVPTNDLLDYQNYILLETGYPFEFYDLTKIRNQCENSNFQLSLETGNSDETISVNNKNIRVGSDILTIKADEQILSIGGIVNNDQYNVTSSTSCLLIEGSIFNSKKIRQMSRELGMRTERSARYEKDLVISDFSDAILRLLLLLKTNNPNLSYSFHTISNTKAIDTPEICLTAKNINKILGPITSHISDESDLLYLNSTQISEYLNRLNFSFVHNSENRTWLVKVPKSRINDITREIDVIEEIGRLHGFNNFSTCLPNVLKVGKEDLSYRVRKKLTTNLLNEGFTELCQYSLTTDEIPNSISIINPLFTECSGLRQTLLPSLLKTINSNLKNTNKTLTGFEYGHIFKKDNDNLNNYQEIEYVSGVFGDETRTENWATNQEQVSSLNWFSAKGKLEGIFKRLNLLIEWKLTNPKFYKTILHPYRTATLYFRNGVEFGYFGQVHPILANKLGLPENIYLFECNFELIRNQFKLNKLSNYTNYSSYPKIVKDLSFLVDKTISFDQIQENVFRSGTEFLVNVELVDVYEDKQITENLTSLCIQLTFQASNKTLLTKEVEHIIHNIQTQLIQNFNVTIRV